MEPWREDLYGEIYHHGILGQKWGRQNGPPYPLAAGAHSSSEKKAGWKKSLGKTIKDYRTKKKRQKSAAKARVAKAKKAEEAANREKNLRNPLWLKQHMNELSNTELKAAKERILLENDLRKESIRKLGAGKEYIDLLLGYAKSGVDTVDTVQNISKKVKEIKSPEENKNKEAKFREEAKNKSEEELTEAIKRASKEDAYVKVRMKHGGGRNVVRRRAMSGSKTKKKW